MPRSVRRLFTLCLAGLLLSSCGGSPASPSDERVSGVWLGHSTLTAASGGECVGARLQAATGGRDVFAAPIGQTGSQLVARVAYQGNGTECAFAGSAAGEAVSLSMTSCRLGRVLSVRCSDGALRDIEMVTNRIAARASNGTGGGTETSTWSVSPPGGATSLGVLTVTATFTWNVLRLPNSDFHVFDGSILPGYVDGVITIPEEPNPFCLLCGWF